MSPHPTILLAYDGSAGAEHAIRVAGDLLPGGQAVVLTVWEPLLVALARHPLTALAPVPWSAAEEDDRSAASAGLVAEAGAELARSVGLDARPVARADERDIHAAIIELANEIDAGLIVTGARGLRGLARRGSVSEHVLEHAGRPVLVVPEGAS